MSTYTFYLHDGPDSIPAFEIQLLDDDARALAYGRRLLSDRPRYCAVAIAEADREVGRLDRDLSIAPADAQPNRKAA